MLISLIVAGNPAAGLAKGVEVNDKDYLDRFPFLAPAHQGLLRDMVASMFPPNRTSRILINPSLSTFESERFPLAGPFRSS